MTASMQTCLFELKQYACNRFKNINRHFQKELVFPIFRIDFTF